MKRHPILHLDSLFRCIVLGRRGIRLGIVFCCFPLSLAAPLQAQTPRITEKQQAYRDAATPVATLEALLALGEEYHSLPADSIYAYALTASQLLRQQQGKSIRGDGASLSRYTADLMLGRAYYVWGWVDSAMATIAPALEALNPESPGTEKGAERQLWYALQRLQALCLGGVSRFPEALNTLNTLLTIAEKHRDALAAAYAANTLGSVHLAMGKTEQGMQWIRRAANYPLSGNSTDDFRAANQTNMAFGWLRSGHLDSAAAVLPQAIALSRTAQNRNTEATALRLTSIVAQQRGDLELAEQALLDMVAIRKTLQPALNQLQDNLTLANFYAGSGRLDEAIRICRENLEATEKADGGGRTNTTAANLRMEYYTALAAYYDQAGDEQAYRQTLENLLSAKDSFYLANSADALAEWEARFELQEKENVILRQRVNLTRKNLLLYGGSVLALLLAAAGMGQFLRIRRRQQIALRQAREEERATAAAAVREAGERERRRIAADLHDNLGVQANAILYHTELLHHEPQSREQLLDDLRETARQMLRNLRETLWAMRSSDVAADDWWRRIIGFCQQMNRLYAPIHIAAEGQVPTDWPMPAERALHLVLVIQEAVQNAVRHASAQNIRVQIDCNAADWVIRIADDGIGFDPEQVSEGETGHYGLTNMRERALSAGLQYAVESAPGQGTTIVLRWRADYPNGPLTEGETVRSFEQLNPS